MYSTVHGYCYHAVSLLNSSLVTLVGGDVRRAAVSACFDPGIDMSQVMTVAKHASML